LGLDALALAAQALWLGHGVLLLRTRFSKRVRWISPFLIG